MASLGRSAKEAPKSESMKNLCNRDYPTGRFVRRLVTPGYLDLSNSVLAEKIGTRSVH